VGVGLQRGHPQSVFWEYTPLLFPHHRLKLTKSFPHLRNKASPHSSAVSSVHKNVQGARCYPSRYRVPAETEQHGRRSLATIFV